MGPNSGGSRISQTGAPTPEFKTKTYYLQDICRKLHENERNLTGGASLASTPPPDHVDPVKNPLKNS